MKRVAAVFFLLILPFIATTAIAADSSPYLSTAPSDLSNLSSPANCQTKLDNNGYDCQVKASFSTHFTDCYQFISPGLVSAHFDLFPAALGSRLGCSCNPTGSFNNPKFNASPNAFSCDGTDGFGDFFDFTGKVTPSKISGRASSSVGDSFLFTCTKRSTPCP